MAAKIPDGHQSQLEASGVAVMMSGGPAYTHIPMVIDAIDELESSLQKG